MSDSSAELPGDLTGRWLVRALRPALHDAKRLFPKVHPRMIVRRHALKLRYWPNPQTQRDPNAMVLDLDWSWIQALKSQRIGELRIDDTICGFDNLRVIFHVPSKERDIEPKRVLWVLGVLQKKRDDFSRANLVTFKARRNIVKERGNEILRSMNG